MVGNTGRMTLPIPVDKQAKLDAIARCSRRYLVNEAIDHYGGRASRPPSRDVRMASQENQGRAGENPKRRGQMDTTR